MFDLQNRVAVVTGAARGMGLGIARSLAQQHARVVINDLYAERAEEAAAALRAEGLQAMAVAADVTDLQSVKAMQEVVRAQWGEVSILVNNAGIPAAGMQALPFRHMPLSDWDTYLDLNVKAVLNGCKVFLDPMCDAGWGRIITIVSEAWRSGDGMGISLYAAGKAAAIGFSRQLSGEVAPSGVTVNCIALGMMDNVPGMEKLARHIPARRLGSADDVGACAVYLASDEASWVTGQCLPVNGGAITA